MNALRALLAPRRVIVALGVLVAASMWHLPPAGTATLSGLDALVPSALSSASSEVPSRPTARIAFTSWSEDGTDIFTINPDGSQRRRFTLTGRAGGPTWSPKGHRIAFHDRGDIWVAHYQRKPRRLTSGPSKDWNPEWSPDGDRILFTRYPHPGGAPGIAVLRLDTGRARIITPRPTDDWRGVEDATWSPDGTHIAFTRVSTEGDDYSYDTALFTMAIDGSDLRHVITSYPRNPSWSPDGKWLLYTDGYTGRGGDCDAGVHRVRVDGTEPQQIYKVGCESTAGSWNPNASRVAVTSYGPEDGWLPSVMMKGQGLWTMSPEGTDHRLVARRAWDPAWQRHAAHRHPPGTTPTGIAGETGQRVIYSAPTAAGSDIFSIEPDGSGRTRLTYRGDAGSPVWAPDGSLIAFTTIEGVWVMRPDGSGQQLVEEEVSARDPVFSPDGSRLLWSTGDRLRIEDLRSGTVEDLLIPGLWPSHATWSPDGDWLAFASPPEGEPGLDAFVVRPDGSDLRRITWTAGSEQELAWSPSGDRIAYTYATGGPRKPVGSSVRTIRPDGQGQRVVVRGPGLDYTPSWAEDGQRLVLYSDGPQPFGNDPSPGLWIIGGGDRARHLLENRAVLNADW